MEEIVLVKLAKNKDKRAFIELLNIIKEEIYIIILKLIIK